MGLFVEKLLAKKINFTEEIRSLETLYNTERYWDNYSGSISASAYVDNNFLSWKYRGTFITQNELKEQLGINAIIWNCFDNDALTEDQFVEYLEFLFNILAVVRYDSGDHVVYSMRTNILHCLEAIQYFIPNIKEKDALYRMVPKNPTMDQAIETMKDESLADLLYDYVHHDTKGDLQKKSMILGSIWKCFEGHRKEIERNNKALESEIGKLANTCDIRHKPDAAEADLLSKLNAEEKEELFDLLFQLYVDAFATLEASQTIADAEALLAKGTDPSSRQ
jgi:hypothetical protein